MVYPQNPHSSIPGFLISLDIFMNPVRVEVNDKMQKGYVYFRTKPMGRAFRPGFTPELTPKQMLELGVFGGKYMTDCRKEFPASWFTRRKAFARSTARLAELFWRERIATTSRMAAQRLDSSRRSARLVPMVLPILLRTPRQDDLRQVARWRAVRRHIAQLKKHCKPRDLNCRRRQRQALLHWAYDSRKI